jgi:hypothetical protein
MRNVRGSRPTKASINLRSATFTLSAAKTYLGRLMEKAGKGEPVYIVRGHRRFMLQEVPTIDPIPIRPPGYFANVDTEAETEELNALAKASVVRAPDDME